jgi:hypothetical protein
VCSVAIVSYIVPSLCVAPPSRRVTGWRRHRDRWGLLMSVQVIDGKVHDAEGRLLWVDGFDGSGRPMTERDLLLNHFRSLQDILDAEGHRAAVEATEANFGMDVWGAVLRERLSARLSASCNLPAHAPSRWIAEQLVVLLDEPLLWDGLDVRRVRICDHQVELARARVEGRMELLYEVCEFFLDRTETGEPSATEPAGMGA